MYCINCADFKWLEMVLHRDPVYANDNLGTTMVISATSKLIQFLSIYLLLTYTVVSIGITGYKEYGTTETLPGGNLSPKVSDFCTKTDFMDECWTAWHSFWSLLTDILETQGSLFCWDQNWTCFCLSTNCYIWWKPNIAHYSENSTTIMKQRGGSIMLRVNLFSG